MCFTPFIKRYHETRFPNDKKPILIRESAFYLRRLQECSESPALLTHAILVHTAPLAVGRSNSVWKGAAFIQALLMFGKHRFFCDGKGSGRTMAKSASNLFKPSFIR